MKDQWSGNTLRALRLTKFADPSRSSTQFAVPPTARSACVVTSRAPLPVTRSDRFDEVALRDEEALLVDVERQLWQWPCGGAEHDCAVVRHVERRLVAGAQQVVRLLLVE